jgi:hypothetical protein
MALRHLPILLGVFLGLAPCRAADDPLSRLGAVDILPGKASIFIGNVTLTMPPFTRKDGVLCSTYSADVFPYFFFDDKGTIAINVPDEMLRRVFKGEAVDFTGRGTSDYGENRRIVGHAEPTDRTHGRIRVRIYVSKRISLDFNTLYQILPPSAPPQRIRIGMK